MFNLTTQSKLYLCETIKFKELYLLLWNWFWGRFYWIKINSFSAHISMPKLLHWGFCLYFSVLRSTSVRSSVGFKISARVRQSSMTSNTLWASVNFFGQITIQRYFVFVSTVELWTLYIQKLPYMNKFCEYILKKIGPMHAHFQYSARKLMPSLKSVLLWCILREN